MNITQCKALLESMADMSKAEHFGRFFKSGPGQYGEGDRFLGIPVPATRSVAVRCTEFDTCKIAALLRDPFHEVRLLGALLLVKFYSRERARRDEVAAFYLKKLELFNNWDLIDLTCYNILGHYLLDRNRAPLYELALSGNLWRRRAAIVSTMAFIRVRRETEETFRIAEMLLGDREDLMHKAVGWLLREAGKVSRQGLDAFLEAHFRSMSRTALRYAIEKHPETERKAWLSKR
ncbi:MAG: DNA alkylation repair protein [Rikenellaceae bacterium]|jgi:3-methyladenine DNA glycosylase AlkD|nr:DNA alkylation repair protein [Rikenellaceae bacterium]